jgi:hypothetical protein
MKSKIKFILGGCLIMKFNVNVTKEDLKGYGKVAGRVGKAIVVEGTKALVLKSAAKVITASFEDGLTGVKKLTVDDVIGKSKKDKEDKPKWKLFGKKEDKVEEILEVMVEETVEDKLKKAKELTEK